MGATTRLTVGVNCLILGAGALFIVLGLLTASDSVNKYGPAGRLALPVFGILLLLPSLFLLTGVYFKNGILIALDTALVLLLICLLLIRISTCAMPVSVPKSSLSDARDFPECLPLPSPGISALNATCLVPSRVCPMLSFNYGTEDDFRHANLTAVEANCCKPLDTCGFEYVTPIQWINPTNRDGSPDCRKWSNDMDLLCYRCESCKEALYQTLSSSQGGGTTVTVVVMNSCRHIIKGLVFLLLIHILLFILSIFVLVDTRAANRLQISKS